MLWIEDFNSFKLQKFIAAKSTSLLSVAHFNRMNNFLTKAWV